MCMHNYIDTLLQVTNKFLAYAYTVHFVSIIGLHEAFIIGFFNLQLLNKTTSNIILGGRRKVG